MEKNLRSIIEECIWKERNIFMIGNLNARTGSEPGNRREEEERGRKEKESQDTLITSEGKRLLKLCEEFG